MLPYIYFWVILIVVVAIGYGPELQALIASFKESRTVGAPDRHEPREGDRHADPESP
jgi:hypothetical protein